MLSTFKTKIKGVKGKYMRVTRVGRVTTFLRLRNIKDIKTVSHRLLLRLSYSYSEPW